MENYQEIKQEETIDIKDLLFKFLNIWPYFIISLTISLLIAHFYNKYSDPVYKSSATVLVDPFKESSNPFLGGMMSFM